MLVNGRRWNAGRQHSCTAVPWKRSHTALWFGERQRDPMMFEAAGGEASVQAAGDPLGSIVSEHGADADAEASERLDHMVDEAEDRVVVGLPGSDTH